MGKYVDIESSILSLFGTAGWTANNIAAFPANFEVPVGVNEYIKVNIKYNGLNRVVIKGLVLIDIFVEAGKGPTRASQIADTLNSFLEDSVRSIDTYSIQFATSSLSDRGKDPVNSNLHRADYTIPFNCFGVS